jgi:hypothetical protein
MSFCPHPARGASIPIRLTGHCTVSACVCTPEVSRGFESLFWSQNQGPRNRWAVRLTGRRHTESSLLPPFRPADKFLVGFSCRPKRSSPSVIRPSCGSQERRSRPEITVGHLLDPALESNRPSLSIRPYRPLGSLQRHSRDGSESQERTFRTPPGKVCALNSPGCGCGAHRFLRSRSPAGPRASGIRGACGRDQSPAGFQWR